MPPELIKAMKEALLKRYRVVIKRLDARITASLTAKLSCLSENEFLKFNPSNPMRNSLSLPETVTCEGRGCWTRDALRCSVDLSLFHRVSII